MITLKCDAKRGGCGASFEVDETKINKDEEYMQCPNCGAICPNPLK